MPSSIPPLEIRSLRSAEDLAACVALQELTWGENFADRVPRSILKVSQRVGGVVAGALTPEGVLAGFVFGLTGVEPSGRIVHWSDMLAIRPEFRDQGLGLRLKRFQADLLRPLGVTAMLWTYDPLVARNAHFNLMKLGARPIEYVEDMYGETDSPVHRGIGTDRFVVSWDLRTPGSGDRAGEGADPGSGAVDGGATGGTGATGGMGATAGERVEVLIPADIVAVQNRDPGAAWSWRLRTREAFTRRFGEGFRVVGFGPGPEPELRAYHLLR